MENENKNKGYSRRKHKSYFISPNAPTEAPKDTNAPIENASANANSSQRAHKHKNKPKPHNPQKPEAVAPQAPSVSASNNAVEQAPKPQGNDNKNRKNKNRHKKPLDNSSVEPQGNRANTEVTPESSDNDFGFSKLDKLEKSAPKKLESFSSSPEYQKYKDYDEYTYGQLYLNNLCGGLVCDFCIRGIVLCSIALCRICSLV